MKTLYIECKMGAAGDMLMSALFELLSDEEQSKFINTINRLLGSDIQIDVENKKTCGICGSHIHVKVMGIEENPLDNTLHENEKIHVHIQESNSTNHHDCNFTHDNNHNINQDHYHNHNHNHNHYHNHYSYDSVKHIIENMDIDDNVKHNALSIYEIIGNAEAKVHNTSLENIHFHEVGSLDAMVDIMGCCILISYINPDKIICSPIHVGNGTVKCAHGVLPVPAPATAEILQQIPYYTGSIDTELCTPTGAAILRHFVDEFCDMPTMNIEKIGYGIGNKEFDIANAVRIFYGNLSNTNAKIAKHVSSDCEDYLIDHILEISCNLDDMTGEELGYAMEVLLDAGALDVFFQPIYMKKNRPGVLLKCFCEKSKKELFTDLFFRHTTTRGVRYMEYDRTKLSSSFEEIQTCAGSVRNKISTGKEIRKSKLEFDDLKKIAKALDVSLDEAKKLIFDTGAAPR